MPDQKPSTRPCPYCHEEIRLDALRCSHCKGAGIKQAVATQVPSARTSVQKVSPERGKVKYDDLPPCPPAILDEAPGGGVGVWVLVESTDTTCTYEYAGGIA
jgi:hypothetical protein